MLMLVCEVGGNRYLINCVQVAEVIPRVELTPFTTLAASAQGARLAVEDLAGDIRSAAIAGLLTYRNRMLPVLDLCQLFYRRPSPLRVSSRIIVLEPLKSQHSMQLALLAERVMNTACLETFQPMGAGVEQERREVVKVETAAKQRPEEGDPESIWGRLFVDDDGMVQQLRIEPLVQMIQQQLGLGVR